MKEELLEVIENQLRENDPKSTSKAYKKMLEHDISEEEAKEYLTAYLEFYIRKMLIEKSEFDEEVWSDELDRITTFALNDITGEKIDNYHLEKNITRARKEVSFIPNGCEEEFIDELGVIEATLFSYYLVYKITSKDAKRIVLQVINNLYAILHQKKIDFFTNEDKKIYLMTKFLESKCNPYISNYVQHIVEEQIEVSHENDFEIFQPMLKCLERVYRSIEFWDKEFGHNGYFNYLESVSEGLNNGNPYSVFTEMTIKKGM